MLRAGIAFHAAIAHLPRPAFLDRRDDPWSYRDRVAREELPIDADPAALELLTPLAGARRPVDLAAQVVHGDLAGNVLFAAGLPPAIIDWPAYWRPASWALAVAVADALCWYGATPDLAARWSHQPAWGQMLVRALIYRIATHEAALGPNRMDGRAPRGPPTRGASGRRDGGRLTDSLRADNLPVVQLPNQGETHVGVRILGRNHRHF